MLLRIDLQLLLEIDPQKLLKIDPQTLLKISFTMLLNLKTYLQGLHNWNFKQNKTTLRKRL